MDPQQLPFSSHFHLLAFALLVALVVAPMMQAQAQAPHGGSAGGSLPTGAGTARGEAGAASADGQPVRICNWLGGKKAAVSLRFDDSELSHIEIGVPELDKYGLIGTWLVSPGYRGYLPYASIWEGKVVREGHELGDHTMWHEGARTDEEADREVGEPAVLLHKLQPQLGLITFAAGGGTEWLQRKPMNALMAKYDLVHVGGVGGVAMSCTEAYPSFSAKAFDETLKQCVAEGAWFQPYFHTICPASEHGGLYITPEVFSECIETVHAHRDEIWQAGMNVIGQYARERMASRLWVHSTGADALEVSLTCATDPTYYKQPLTMELDLPEGANAVSVTDKAGTAVATRIETVGQRRVARWEVAPVDMKFTVRAKGVGADSRIEEMKTPGPHPYLFFTAAEAPALLAKTSDPLAKSMWEAILRNADSYVAEATPAQIKEKVLWDFSQRLRVLGVAYGLTHEESYARAGVAYLMAAAADDSWHAGKPEMLRTGQAVGTLGIGYDLFYDVLTEQQRAQIREVALRHGLQPIMEESRKGDWWTDWYRANWGAVIYSNAGVAALAFLPDDPAMADWVRLGTQKMWHYTQSLSAAGGWGESASYGSFAWSNGLVFLDSLRRAIGVDLFNNTGLPQLPFWFINLLEPDGRNYVPFSNAGAGVSRSSSILALVAHEYRDGVVQSVAKQMLSQGDQPSVLDFLWYDPTVESRPLSTLPLTKLWPELDWATMRSSWDDPNAVLFGLKGGQKDWDHAHHDTNSFVLYAYGKPLLVDLLYPKEAWGCRTEAHNAIMVDGKEQRGIVDVMGTGGPPAPTYRGLIGSVTDTPWYTRMVADATLAYEQADVKSALREVIYLRQSAPRDPDDYFIVFDDVNATRPVRMDWLLHTYGDLKVSGKTFTITQDDAAVDVTMALPLGLGVETFEKKLADMAPQPFPSADTLRYLKAHPTDPVEHGYFVSVLAPRAASTPSSARVTPLSGLNVVGATVEMGATRDVALFALDEPEMSSDTSGGTVGVIGRTCFVRWSGGRLSALALHSGQKVTINGAVIVDSPSAGDATLTFTDTAITGRVRLGGGEGVRIHVPSRPVKVLAGGREQAFEYDPDAECIELSGLSGRDIEILLQ